MNPTINMSDVTMRSHLILERLQSQLRTARQLCADSLAWTDKSTPAERVQAILLPGTLHSFGLQHSAKWQVAWVSATGQRHLAYETGCEDSCQAQTIGTHGAMHLAVADGVSQGARGDLASATAAEVVMCSPEHQPGMDSTPYAQSLYHAEAAVQMALQEVTQIQGGTTLACAWLGQNGQGFISRVGDCRVYAWQVSRGKSQTPSHQVANVPWVQVVPFLPDQNYIELGETPCSGIPPSNPARMLGVGALGTPDILPIEVPVGAGLLLSSDGLHDVMPEINLTAALAPLCDFKHRIINSKRVLQNLQNLCAQLVREAQDCGSDDDVSVMLVRRVG